jgi:beta-lactamase class C
MVNQGLTAIHSAGFKNGGRILGRALGVVLGRMALRIRLFASSLAAFGLALVVAGSASQSSGASRDAPPPPASADSGSITVPIVDAPRSPSVINYARLDQRLQELMREQAMVGLAVGVVEDGQIRFLKGYGETTAGGDAVTPETVFRWASLSKGVAGELIAKLAAQGRLSLDDPIGRYSYSLRLPGGAEQRATVGDLLSHQLGLFAHANDSKLEDGQDPHALRSALAGLRLICQPGQCHAYQNVAYDAASEVVEKVTGESYQQAVLDYLFHPLGMRSASLTRDGLERAQSWAKPHVGGKNSRPVEVTDFYYRVPAAGGVNSSILDLALWLQGQLGEDKDVVAPQVLDSVRFERASTPGELGRMRKFRERLHTAKYGLGWRIYDYEGHRIVGHRGGVTGYRSLILYDPARKTGVVALWNSSTNQPGGLEFEVMDMLYGLPARDWLALGSKGAEGLGDEEPA